MRPLERKLDRWLPRILTALFGLLLLAAIGPSAWQIARAYWRATNVVVADPAAAVRDARMLIATRSGELEPAALPPSLRLPGLRSAYVHDGHIDLVLLHHPDGAMGVRIWLPNRLHHDRPTPYRDIWAYRYNNDSPVGADNTP
jgi:hypothetical protein